MKDADAHLEVMARSIKQIWLRRFSEQFIERNIKNSPEFNCKRAIAHAMTERKKYTPATTSIAQFSVGFSRTEFEA